MSDAAKWSDEDRARARHEIMADYAASRGVDVPDMSPPPEFRVEQWLANEAATRSQADILHVRTRWRDTQELEASAEEIAAWEASYEAGLIQGGATPEADRDAYFSAIHDAHSAMPQADTGPDIEP
jgi:hypothetical protein